MGAPPHTPPLRAPIVGTPGCPTARGTHVDVAQFLAHVLLSDVSSITALVSELEASVDEDVVVWSPCVCTTSRAALVAALLEGDDAITEVEVAILGTSATEATVHVEWHLRGRFSNVGFLNDDVLVEPSGAAVVASGVLVVEFRQEVALDIRCYYDELGVLEQVVSAPPT